MGLKPNPSRSSYNEAKIGRFPGRPSEANGGSLNSADGSSPPNRVDGAVGSDVCQPRVGVLHPSAGGQEITEQGDKFHG